MDLWRDNESLSWRKLSVLITQLPPESATATAFRLAAPPRAENAEPFDAEMTQWSRGEHLIATLVDELRALRWITEAVNGAQAPKWEVVPVPRPGLSARKPKETLSPEAAEALWSFIKPRE